MNHKDLTLRGRIVSARDGQGSGNKLFLLVELILQRPHGPFQQRYGAGLALREVLAGLDALPGIVIVGPRPNAFPTRICIGP